MRRIVGADLGDLCRLYADALSGPPWNNPVSLEAALEIVDAHMSLPGFDGLIYRSENDVIGASWWDKPTIEDVYRERGEELAAVLAGALKGRLLVWERELLVAPSHQGRGHGTTIRSEFLRVLAQSERSTLVATRMREDNLPTIRVAQKLRFRRTGIRVPSNSNPGLYHEYWLCDVP